MRDPGAIAWIVVAAYLLGALLAYRAASRAGGRERGFWLTVAAVLVLLSLNKQLDLQTNLTEFARAAARHEGWYGWRRDFQGIFLLLIALGAIGCAAGLHIWLRDASAGAKIAATGLAVLLAFIVLRAASFHHIDYWVTIDVGGLRSGWWLELAGIAVIAAGAISPRATPRRRRRSHLH